MQISRKKIVIALIVVLVAAALVVANLTFKRQEGAEVNVEAIKRRDLEAVVSASGTIQPKTLVNISADTQGRVTDLAVNEGDTVKRGEFLLQIDPRNLETRVQSGVAGMQAAQSAQAQARVAVESARAHVELARENIKRQRELWQQQLIPKEALDRAENELTVREAELREREQQVRTQAQRIQQERATLDNARYDLSKVRIESPIDGLVTRRNIEQGETVVVGTMNNPGTVLLTVADMSVLEAEVEVDETEIPYVQIGQRGTITIDAFPDRELTAHVTEIGNSPIQATAQQQASTSQATTFKVVLTLDDAPEDLPLRPGFTATADITTATRSNAVAVPSQATAVREVVLDANKQIVRDQPEEGQRRRRSVEPSVEAQELQPGQTREEVEGVFLVRDGRAQFVRIKTGIAGDRYFEVTDGLQEGDQVIVGPFSSVRELKDGDPVQVQQARTR